MKKGKLNPGPPPLCLADTTSNFILSGCLKNTVVLDSERNNIPLPAESSPLFSKSFLSTFLPSILSGNPLERRKPFYIYIYRK